MLLNIANYSSPQRARVCAITNKHLFTSHPAAISSLCSLSSQGKQSSVVSEYFLVRLVFTLWVCMCRMSCLLAFPACRWSSAGECSVCRVCSTFPQFVVSGLAKLFIAWNWHKSYSHRLMASSRFFFCAWSVLKSRVTDIPEQVGSQKVWESLLVWPGCLVWPHMEMTVASAYGCSRELVLPLGYCPVPLALSCDHLRHTLSADTFGKLSSLS